MLNLYSKIPELLDNLVDCSMSEACRRVGMSRQTFWSYMVRCSKGDPEFQAITWNGVVAPLTTHYNNTKAIAAVQIERSAIEHARDGFEQDVFFQGQRMTERVLRPEYMEHEGDEDMLELIAGPNWKDVCFKTVPAKSRQKPSDALVIKMLESHMPKKYGSHQTVDVRLGGVLRLDQQQQAAPKEVEAQPVSFEDAVVDEGQQVERRGGYLALATPAKTSDEFEARAAAGEFDHVEVEVEAADGTTTIMSAAELEPPPAVEKPLNYADPVMRNPRAYMASTGAKPPQPRPNYTKGEAMVGTGKEGIGMGPDPHKLGKDMGFNVTGVSGMSHAHRGIIRG